MWKVMFVVGVTFVILPWLSLQGLKQYLIISSNYAKQVTTMGEGITVQVLNTTDSDSTFRTARANLPKRVPSHRANLDRANTNKLTSSIINLKRPMPIPIPTPSISFLAQIPNAKSDMGLDAGISLDYGWPLLAQGVITSSFGVRYLGAGRSFHYGIDIAAITGTAIVASQGGTVTYAHWQGGYGQVVFVSHSDGSETRYAHMSRILVSEGQQITQGEKLGEVGSTGFATGPHLHFEVHINGEAVNPTDYLLGLEQGSAAKILPFENKQNKIKAGLISRGVKVFVRTLVPIGS